MTMTTHEWTVFGMYTFLLLTYGGYALYGILTSKHYRRRHRHAR